VKIHFNVYLLAKTLIAIVILKDAAVILDILMNGIEIDVLEQPKTQVIVIMIHISLLTLLSHIFSLEIFSFHFYSYKFSNINQLFDA
jgi:hypothetical protein